MCVCVCCVCVLCVCVYIHVYIYMFVCLFTCTQKIHNCMCNYIVILRLLNICEVCACVPVQVCVHRVCVCVPVCVCVCIWFCKLCVHDVWRFLYFHHHFTTICMGACVMEAVRIH